MKKRKYWKEVRVATVPRNGNRKGNKNGNRKGNKNGNNNRNIIEKEIKREMQGKKIEKEYMYLTELDTVGGLVIQWLIIFLSS